MKTVLTLILILLTALTTVHAQIPRTLSYQGVLTDNTGKPRVDGNYAFTFRLYDIASGGTAIWSEEKTLPIKGGLFSTALGDQNPFGPAVKFDRPYWLGLQVGSEDELVQRIPLTSVGYSMSSLRADTAMVAIFTNADTLWQIRNSAISNTGDRSVGIRIDDPQASLHVVGNNAPPRIDAMSGAVVVGGVGTTSVINVGVSGTFPAHAWIQSKDLITSETYNMTLNPLGGNIGIGTMTPQYKLHIDGTGPALALTDGTGSPSAAIRGNEGLWLFGYAGTPGSEDVSIGSQHGIADSRTVTMAAGGFPRVKVLANGNVGIGTLNPTTKLEVDGRTKTSVLEITGGSDLAEPFEMSHAEPLPAGALVVIDKDNPGKLKLAAEAYDKRVAGVISGAGGVNPGLTLFQEGVLAGGQHVALTGKVYALATAANGAIEPGDLLTTSSIPGHAMKASDQARWPGAVIGKAMSSLTEGEGLVLVLVNLQ